MTGSIRRWFRATLGPVCRQDRGGCRCATALEELGFQPEAPAFGDDVQAELVAKPHGIALFFKRAWFVQPTPDLAGRPPDTPVLGEIQLYRVGLPGAAPFTGELPKGLRFRDSRVSVTERLGPPAGAAQ